jgi:hypothetical protein
MKNLLFETVILTEIGLKENKLEYLEEYLIVSPSITIQEGRALITDIITEAKLSMAELKLQADKLRKAAKVQYDNMIAKAQGVPAKIAAAKAWFSKKMASIAKWFNSMKDGIKSQAQKAAGLVKTAVKKSGEAAGGAGKAIKAVAGTKAGKIGAAGLAGVALAGGGYAAYRAAKNKK